MLLRLFALRCCLFCVLIFISVANAHAANEVKHIVFGVSTANAMPLAHFQGEEIDSGIVKDMGEAIANKLGMQPRFVTLSRKRASAALLAGEVDGICDAMPEWYGRTVNWSPPLIANEGWLVAAANVRAPKSLMEIKGEKLGLIAGFVYPELDAAFGKNYPRDDAPNMPSNIRKLLAGRQRYAIVDRLSFEYEAGFTPELRNFEVLVLSRFRSSCAFSKSSKIPFNKVNRAIHQLMKDGTITRILARYR